MLSPRIVVRPPRTGRPRFTRRASNHELTARDEYTFEDAITFRKEIHVGGSISDLTRRVV